VLSWKGRTNLIIYFVARVVHFFEYLPKLTDNMGIYTIVLLMCVH
jgi:hypothetical protein